MRATTGQSPAPDPVRLRFALAGATCAICAAASGAVCLEALAWAREALEVDSGSGLAMAFFLGLAGFVGLACAAVAAAGASDRFRREAERYAGGDE